MIKSTYFVICNFFALSFHLILFYFKSLIIIFDPTQYSTIIKKVWTTYIYNKYFLEHIVITQVIYNYYNKFVDNFI